MASPLARAALLPLCALVGAACALRVPVGTAERLEGRAAEASCTLSASGGDDAPAFLSAAAGAACPTVTIPSGTTLSIRSKLNMTGISDKHIVSLPSEYP